MGLAKSLLAITLSSLAIGDLAIECLGVRAIDESLDVRVATIVARKMKKKVATSRFSNLDSSILILLAMLHRCTLSFF